MGLRSGAAGVSGRMHGRTDARTQSGSSTHLSLQAERDPAGLFTQGADALRVLCLQVPEVRPETEQRVHLRQRAKRHAEGVGELRRTEPGMALSDVRDRRDRGSPELQGQAKPLVRREAGRDPVDLLRQLATTLPRHQPPVLVHIHTIAQLHEIVGTVPLQTVPFPCVRASVRPCV